MVYLQILVLRAKGVEHVLDLCLVFIGLAAAV